METLLDVLNFVGALGLFLFGMKLMSDSLQKLAGDKMRAVLSKMTSNRFSGVLTGAGITTLIQSSSATTVMVVSFVNAGLLKLSGAIAVIMGANIGTTVTAWIISLLGFEFNINMLVYPAIAIAAPFLFIEKRKSVGEFLIGFALLFMGLEALKGGVPDFTLPQYSGVLEFIASLSGYGYLSILLFVLIGTILTVVVQSSSAMMAITLVMCAKGLIGFEVAAALVLGENIGTTITANMAAMMANATAKRAARAHLMFNVIGVVWMLVLFYPFLYLISWIVEPDSGNGIHLAALSIPVALSLFHSIFNIINTSVLVWFIPSIERIVSKIVPINEEEDFRLKFIPTGFMAASELNIEPAKKEIESFSKRVLRMYNFIPELFEEKDEKKFDQLMSRTRKYEEITDRMELEIANYLARVSENELSVNASYEISAMLRIVDNLESIGDSCYQLSIAIDGKKKQNISFTDEMTENLRTMFAFVREAVEVMNSNLSESYINVNGSKAKELETKINNYRDKLRTEHTEAIKNNDYSYQTGICYSNLYAQCEKLADFAINVTEAMLKVHK
ncbi:MAG: Na/Pi cotransporter family protein [Bacteroidales bacterium]|nr:Na/Pi cotransporter family protein [Bacteroidales bacterium]MEE0982654.1 Na/Pi cotransporter family protein [Bacteroidales bacterium]